MVSVSLPSPIALPSDSLQLFPRHHLLGLHCSSTSLSSSSIGWYGAYSCNGQWQSSSIRSLVYLKRPSNHELSFRLAPQEVVPSREGWLQICTKAHELLSKSSLQKIILARQRNWHLQGQLESSAVLSRIAPLNTTGILWTPSVGEDWIGGSPEMLFLRRGKELLLEAVAGTCPIGKDKHQKALFQEELLNCSHRQAEVNVVVEELRKRLTPYCSSIEVGPLETVERGACLHLRRSIRAVCKKRDDRGLVEALHPTPAVDALPLSFRGERQKLEPFARGWYASAVGISTEGHAQFWVLLRCGRFRDAQLTTYTGVGLIPGFEANREWEEIELKESLWHAMAK